MTGRPTLARILTLVHQGSRTRSQLTAQTGLNRSTVAALVAELVDLGLVYETDPDATRQVGRPSPVVHADPRTVAIALNPEVDATTVGIVGLDGRVVRRLRLETPEVPTVAGFLELVAPVVARSRAEHDVVGIGVAVPGLVREEDGVVRWAPHLGWRDEELAAPLADATGLPVRAANDASLGALAEHLFGAGRGVSDLVYLNGGASGIGGGIIADGVPLRGRAGYAGEFGHTRGAEPLEDLVTRADLLRALGLASADADDLEAALLASTDPAVTTLVHRQLGHLATALGNAVNVLNPEVVVLGGFLASLLRADPEFLLDGVGSHSLEASFEGVSLVPAQLGSDLLMIGAAELAFTDLLADPATKAP